MTIDIHKTSFKPLGRKLVDVNPEATRRAADKYNTEAMQVEVDNRIIDRAGRLTVASSFEVPYFKDAAGDQASEEKK